MGVPPTSRDEVYTREVLGRLGEARTDISLLYPLNYRLEILEDIFSLLFLTSEDVRTLQHRDGTRAGSVGSGSGRQRSGSAGVNGSSTLPPQSDGEFSGSLSSTVAQIRSRHGFLMSERVAGDLLSVLQDGMFEMRAARFVLTQPATSETAPTLQPDAIRSSVGASSAQQRAAKLEQYINEARWRLQLVSSKLGIGKPRGGGKTDGNDGDGLRGNWAEFSSDGDTGSEVSESDSESEEEREVKRKHPKKASSDPHHQTEKRPSANQISEPVVAPLIYDRPPPTVVSKSVSAGKISPAIQIQNSLSAGHLGSLQSSNSRHLAHSVPSSPHVGPANLRNQSDFARGGSPSLSSESRNAASDLQHHHHHRLSDTPTHEEAEDSGECADVEEKLSPEQRKRKKRLHSRSLKAAKKRRTRLNERSSSDTAAGGAHGSSVVSQMLASPASLLRTCLRHSNYSRAYEVLKMFGMEGEFGESFVRFSEGYESVSRELAEQSRGVTPRHSPHTLTPQDTGKPPQQSSSSSSLLLHPDAHLHVAIANATAAPLLWRASIVSSPPPPSTACSSAETNDSRAPRRTQLRSKF